MITQVVDALLRGVRGSTVSEIEYEANGLKLHIVRFIGHSQDGATAQAPRLTASAAPVVEGASAPTVNRLIVCAPMHGTFYRSSSPGEPPIVEPGQVVEEGQQLGLLEAMKMLHAVEAEQAGRVLKILAENGSVVEPGAPLFELEALGGEDV